MCNPAAMPFIEGAAVLASQGIAARQQDEYQDKVFDANKASADANAIRQYMTLQARQDQERVASNQAIERAKLEAAGARGTARVAAGEAGVSGNSVAALDQEFTRAAAQFESRKIASQAALDAQFGREYEGIRAGQEAQIRSGVGDYIQAPDFLNVAIRSFAKNLEIRYRQDQNKSTA